MAFGKAEEPPPALSMVHLSGVVQDVVDAETLADENGLVTITADVSHSLMVRADSEQLYRVLSNLVRNARQAIAATKKEGQIAVTAGEDANAWWVRISDSGPGLPSRAQEHLFTPFQGGVSKGGTGLGLAIAAELIKGHGGVLTLQSTGPDGTVFNISLPKEVIDVDRAAE